MSKFIMVGCDLHDRTMMLKIAEGREPAETMSVPNTAAGRARMIERLQVRAQAAGNARILFAYEASGQGFGLYDQLTDAGIQCHVLAPTKIARSAQQKRVKTDEKDALSLLELLKGHVLAGNRLPTIWAPDPQTRDDREVVRARLDAASKLTAVKAQVQCTLKRAGLTRPEGTGQGWTRLFESWLQSCCRNEGLGIGLRELLASILRQLRFLEEEIRRLDQALLRLSESPRYQKTVMKLAVLSGVGVLTAMVFLTELGDLTRFANRRQISAYLGLIPNCSESGQANDRKGHITRQGPSRVRRVLCQAAWARVRCAGPDQDAHRRIVKKNPQHKKIATVAVMRRLAIRMWHVAREAQLDPTPLPWHDRPQQPTTTKRPPPAKEKPSGGSKRMRGKSGAKASAMSA